MITRQIVCERRDPVEMGSDEGLIVNVQQKRVLGPLDNGLSFGEPLESDFFDANHPQENTRYRKGRGWLQ